MQTIHHIAPLRQQVASWRRKDERVALVPTMGNLHQGHIALVEHARTLADHTVVSIFVNPTQFGPNEDFNSYPRTLENDSEKLEAVGVDLIFAPSAAEVYPRRVEHTTQVVVPGLSQILCGASRPVHFPGVAQVVAKLLNMVQPDVAVFGQKDRQQLMIIEHMVSDLNIPVEIIGAPTVREADGLAMSSRNNYLSPQQRQIAPTLYATITASAERIRQGEKDYAALEKAAVNTLEAAGFRPDYFQVRRAEDLGEAGPEDTDLAIFAAAWLGRARLIDNCLLTLSSAGKER